MPYDQSLERDSLKVMAPGDLDMSTKFWDVKGRDKSCDAKQEKKTDRKGKIRVHRRYWMYSKHSRKYKNFIPKAVVKL